MNETTQKNGLFSGLSPKFLALTIIFVLLGEVLIFLPSIANFRIQWMKTRIAQAEIAALAAEASPGANSRRSLAHRNFERCWCCGGFIETRRHPSIDVAQC